MKLQVKTYKCVFLQDTFTMSHVMINVFLVSSIVPDRFHYDTCAVNYCKRLNYNHVYKNTKTANAHMHRTENSNCLGIFDLFPTFKYFSI